MSDVAFKPVPGFPPVAVHAASSLANRTGDWRSVRPVYESKPAPCRAGCPAGEDIPRYFNLLSQGKLREAWEVIREANPLPAVCGRVCYHPCEERCNRGQYDEALSINAVERFVGDLGLAFPPPAAAGEGKEKVVIVGAGPAGLSAAYHLARLGYDVTIYEASASIGGMLALGIPEYRLPRDLLRAEVASIVGLGVNVETGVRVGESLALDQLFAAGFRAVLLAIGAHKPLATLDGREKTGVLDAVEFLREVNEHRVPGIAGCVAVVGGGNVAVDAARSALRLGAREVTILYRRSRDEMPAHPSEVAAAEAEGVQVRLLTAPLRIAGDGRATGVFCRRTMLGAPEASGRRAAVAVAGSEFLHEADTVILALGQAPDSAAFAAMGLPTGSNGTLVVDPRNLATARRGVFAAGDAVTGPARVVDAIAAGRRAALSIHAFVSGAEAEPEASAEPVPFASLNLDYFRPSARVATRERAPQERIADFRETTLPLRADEVPREVARCFSCGLCNGCDNCWLYCPDVAVSRAGGEYAVDYDYCKGCGLCATECPRAAISLREEVL